MTFERMKEFIKRQYFSFEKQWQALLEYLYKECKDPDDTLYLVLVAKTEEEKNFYEAAKNVL